MYLLSDLGSRPKANIVFSVTCVVLNAVNSLGMRVSPCRQGAIASFPGSPAWEWDSHDGGKGLVSFLFLMSMM